MTKYVINGTIVRLHNDEDLNVIENLRAGNYNVCFDANSGTYFLKKTDNFSKPPKLYGDVEKNTNRILNTFNDREGTTGVLLSGEKGSGKSLLAKNISRQGYFQSIPTLIVNEPFYGEDFNIFINSIEQDIIILFDEYEKVYRDHQDKLLTLMDGTTSSKKLCVFTVNDSWKVGPYMINRTGRIFYHIKYKSLSPEFIEEYASDRLVDKTRVNDLVSISKICPKMNFDVLKSIVEEVNRYGSSIDDILSIMNVSTVDVKNFDNFEYGVVLKFDGKTITKPNASLECNPMNNKTYLGEDELDFSKINIQDIVDKGVFKHPDIKFDTEDEDIGLSGDHKYLTKADFSRGTFSYKYSTTDGLVEVDYRRKDSDINDYDKYLRLGY